MAPQSNSVEIESIDVIDVAADSPQKEQPQQRRLEDVRRVRDEADGLRQEICQLRIRLEEVEEESKFHAAKANELTELLMKSNNGENSNGIDETVLKQSEDLAKKACQIESLEKKITQLTTEKALLEIERDNAKKETAEMSNVVRALQKVNSPDNSFREGDEEEDDDDDSEDSEEVVLTPETALDLTLGNLKDHIEMLEDGLQASSSLNSNQKKAISTLEADIKAQQAQIGMLEELFKELNAADRISSMKKAKEEEKLAAAKAAAEAEKEEACQKSESSDVKEPAAKDAPATKGAKEASTTEETLNKLGSIFRSIGMSSKPSKPKPVKKEKRPEIPAEAATAAHAAAIIMGQSPDVPKQKKSEMKKVKIRFKKAGLEGTYTGPLVDKKPHGVGTIRFTNGNTYLGEMKRGKMSGSGTLYTKNNGVMRGLFENNQFVGESGDESSSHSSSSSSSNNNPASDETNKPCDATATTAETENDEAKANAVAALELDAFSPSNIAGDEIDDSFNMMVNLDGMERKAELAEIRKESEREENESFLKEFSGSEHSSSLRSDLLDESNSSHSAVDAQDIF